MNKKNTQEFKAAHEKNKNKKIYKLMFLDSCTYHIIHPHTHTLTVQSYLFTDVIILMYRIREANCRKESNEGESKKKKKKKNSSRKIVYQQMSISAYDFVYFG